ncbi:MAG TPA: glucose-6-phosphate isomerase [Oscillospiraceae bacterium]|nr:glucose-6-phosphate isomerase [Oscillospiraceae bacterium]HPF55462.1 glucose-6-phosphate isomerase [Clostridiales bacterium]HPK34296.1 glucose-6-phosphate isomerase [Oscillospiraceae bacterium]HPR74801.1 glucose-6-phosphate isomerase [Oscillospiraceae bacterium]
MSIKLDERFLSRYINTKEYTDIAAQIETAQNLLMSKNGPGNDFLGWLDLPENYDKAEFERIKAAAKRIRAMSGVLIVIGIGGSYLGARAAIELLRGSQYNLFTQDMPQIFFAGCNISSDYLNQLLNYCQDREVCVNVVSKSGTTTEPAIAFRAFSDLMKKKYGANAKERIFVTTDKSRGTLKALADKEGYETFVIADDIGGRYSVLTAPGLLPMAVAGIDIDAVMRGALNAKKELCDSDIETNACLKYSAIRNILYRKGFSTEILVGFEPDFTMMGEWFKQLYGESEGKDNKGIFPASATFSTDLHSLGQYIQQGRRNLFETVVWFKQPKSEYIIGYSEGDADGLNYLEGKGVSFVNNMAMEGTLSAHNDGGVPCVLLECDRIDAYNFGYMVYFFEKACAISGYLLGVNPFDQPGVEFYKKNMFKLLGKPTK